MYPPLLDRDFEVNGKLRIPLEKETGREISICITGYYEGDTNATIYNEDEAEVNWVDSDVDLTADELNTVVLEPDITLWDWIMDHLSEVS